MMFTPCKLTQEQSYAMDVARVGLMAACPFYAYYFYSSMKEVPTNDIPTLATDGRRIFFNPAYVAALRPPERVFALAHEVDHVIKQHPQRMKHYGSQDNLRGLPWDAQHFNVSADFTVNAGLIDEKIGVCNPDWLFDPAIGGQELPEDVYERTLKQQPPNPKGAKGQGQGKSDPQQGSTYGDARKLKGAAGDARARAAAGSFDQVLPPSVDPVTGREDVPDAAEFREAVARAAAAAKAMGKLPASMQRMVDEILQPQVDWREHLRMEITGRIGYRRETWDKPNRRRLVLNPVIITPGRRGPGAGTVVVGVDTSGSIGQQELNTFFAEVGGVLADVRPKRIVLIACDAAVQQVDEASSLDELQGVRAKGLRGGGGTRFEPVFEHVEKENMRPDALIYLTDMLGSFPKEKPGYPVIWCSTSKGKHGPFGETVEVDLRAR